MLQSLALPRQRTVVRDGGFPTHYYPSIATPSSQLLFFFVPSSRSPKQSAITITTRVTEYNQTRLCHSIKGTAVDCDKLWGRANAHASNTYFVAQPENFTLLVDHSVQTPTLNSACCCVCVCVCVCVAVRDCHSDM